MKRFLRATGWTILAVAVAALLFVAWAGEIKWLQYTLAGGGLLWAIGWHIQQWQDRQDRRYAELNHRLAEIERSLSDIRRLLAR